MAIINVIVTDRKQAQYMKKAKKKKEKKRAASSYLIKNVFGTGNIQKNMKIYTCIRLIETQLLLGNLWYSKKCVTPILQYIHWLPIKQHIHFKILHINYKALNSLVKCL